MSILNLTHADDGTSNLRQLVGSHVSQHTRHVAEFVLILLVVPAVGSIGEELVVVLSLVMSGVEQILKIVEAYTIGQEFFFLCVCSECHDEQCCQ